jgi:hypothetical protein
MGWQIGQTLAVIKSRAFSENARLFHLDLLNLDIIDLSLL